MLGAYISAVVLCFVAASQCAAHPRYRSGGAVVRTMRRERSLWTAMAAFLAILAVYRQFDLADLITGLGRAIAADHNWYDQRRPFQVVMLGLIVIAVGTGGARIIKSVSAVNRLALAALAASTMLVLLLGTSVLSLHWTDTLLRSGYHRANVYNVVEAGSLATILAAALFTVRK